LSSFFQAGFDGRYPDLDYYLIFTKLFMDEFGEMGFKNSEAPVQLPIKIGNFLERRCNRYTAGIQTNKYFIFHL